MEYENNRRKRTFLSGTCDHDEERHASREAAYEVLVDNVTARENVTRFAMHQGYKVQVKEQGDDFILQVTK